MPAARKAPVSQHVGTTAPRDTHTVPLKTSPAVRQAAAQLVARPGAPTSAVFTPWNVLTGQAQARYKTELAAALAAYQDQANKAGALLDTAYAMAEQVSGQLQAAAWAAFNHYMKLAADQRAAILGPAVQAYDDTMTTADSDYQQTLSTAENAYAVVLGNVQRAQNDAKAAQQAV